MNYVLYLVIYLYGSFAIQRIADKTNTPQSWLAWIPVAQLYLLVKIANKSNRWFWAMVAPFLLIIGTLLLYIVFRSVPAVRMVLAGLYVIGLIGLVVAGVTTLMVWTEIVKRLGKPTWLVVLLLIPLCNLIFLGYLAFSPATATVTTLPQPPVS